MGLRRAAALMGALGLAWLGCAGGAIAGDSSLEAKWRHACWSDAFSFCPFRAIAHDRAGVRDCLVRHIDLISRPCREVIEQARAQGIQDPRDPRAREAPDASSAQSDSSASASLSDPSPNR
jgi:hypothetical protein